MFTTPTASQESLFEITQVALNAAKEITQAQLQFANTASKTYFDAFLTCCKLGKDGINATTKAATPTKG